MQVEAIYNRGKLQFTKPIRLAHDCFPVQVVLPDNAIETNNNNPAGGDEKSSRPHIQAMLDDLNAILDAPVSPDENFPELTRKQEERVEAFELRKKSAAR